ncbi:unnamed protein product [Phytomonas sp. Hart1]|nr:unnamed protein product [Phytomonas sp. Hart1]|eukprot:CCW71963.1 unnamed protein product [Phytomonas sp. isolate Hart1]
MGSPSFLQGAVDEFTVGPNDGWSPCVWSLLVGLANSESEESIEVVGISSSSRMGFLLLVNLRESLVNDGKEASRTKLFAILVRSNPLLS